MIEELCSCFRGTTRNLAFWADANMKLRHYKRRRFIRHELSWASKNARSRAAIMRRSDGSWWREHAISKLCENAKVYAQDGGLLPF